MDPRIASLLSSLGVDAESFRDLLEWVLCERLILEMAQQPDIDSVIRAQDGRRQFKRLLEQRTRRSWTNRDVGLLFDRVVAEKQHHEREPIPLEEAILLRLTKPMACVRCSRKPPEVVLHIDHVVPASKGGPSRIENLQFLCASCNLKKSNKREVVSPWLDLR